MEEKVHTEAKSGPCISCNEGANIAYLHDGCIRYLACQQCHRKYRTESRCLFMVYVPGGFEATASTRDGLKVRPLVWKQVRENGRNFVYCPCGRCGRILKLLAVDIRYDGHLSHDFDLDGEGLACATCSHCGRHNVIYFEGFEPVRGPSLELEDP